MNLQIQTGPYCLACSTAMVLDLPLEVIHQHLGHNGTDIWWTPTGMRGVHIQEIKAVCLFFGVALVEWELNPCSAPDAKTVPRELYDEQHAYQQFMRKLIGRKAILIMPRHACAWDGHMVYDPKGFIKSIWEYHDIHTAFLAFDFANPIARNNPS